MGGMMSMLSVHMARNAQVIVVTARASHELGFWVDFHTRIASACRNLRLLNNLHLLLSESSGHFHFDLLLPRLHPLGSAVDNISVAHKSLNEPVVVARAMDTVLHTA